MEPGNGENVLRRRRSRALAGILAAGVVGGLLPVAATASPSATAPTGHRQGLSRHDRQLLATARGEGRSSVVVMVASEPGAGPAVADGLSHLGGKLRYRDDALGYQRHVVPVENVGAAARLAGVAAVQIDEAVPVDEAGPTQASPPATGGGVQPPGPATPAENPYLPTRDIGAPQFVAAHPGFDGRGVTIGVIDTGVDVLTPELQTATLADGTPTGKIADSVTVTDPLTDHDPTWVDMAAEVTATGGRLAFASATYQAPADGSYRAGIFDERQVGGDYDGDVNRDGNRPGSSGVFAVLWEPATGRVWVDTDQDHSFADERAMLTYRDHHDVGLFGTDDPTTPVRETVPFVVQVDSRDKFVDIGIAAGSHGTHVAGIAAGKGFFGGAFDGAAPQARVVSVRACLSTTCPVHAMTEGMIYAVKHAHVDVANMSISNSPRLNDGREVASVLANRLIDRYGVQLFVSACNFGPGLNTVGSPSIADKAMGLGASITRQTARANDDVELGAEEGLFWFSARGPREDGGLKPDIVAPGSALSAIPAWMPGKAAPYALPPGYAVYQGTSMSAPQATGGAALLIAAAKQAGVRWAPDQLRQAIRSSARFLPAVGAHEQGDGLFQVGAAWDLLGRNLKPPAAITTAAPVHTVLSSLLATPDTGPGIYEREGWSAGQRATRTITVTRTSGGSRAPVYDVDWVGDDATFASARSVALPLDQPVGLAVTVAPRTAGVHSAILRLDDPATPGIDHEVLNTVVTTDPLGEGSGFSLSYQGQADRAAMGHYFVEVPPGVGALTVALEVTSGEAGFILYHPGGYLYPQEPGESPEAGAPCAAPCRSSRTITHPPPGVYEVAAGLPTTPTVFDHARTSSTTFVVSATLAGVDVAPATWDVGPAAPGTTARRSYTFTNRFGPFTGQAVGTALASTFAGRQTIATDGTAVFDVDVPAGTTSLSARTANASDPKADLDLVLLDCSSSSCVLAQSAANLEGSEEFVEVPNPTPGHWKAVVTAFGDPGGTVAYDLTDMVVNPGFGSVKVDDTASSHPAGDAWSGTAEVTALASPGSGRALRGAVDVMAGGAVVGSGEVRLTPAAA